MLGFFIFSFLSPFFSFVDVHNVVSDHPVLSFLLSSSTKTWTSSTTLREEEDENSSSGTSKLGRDLIIVFVVLVGHVVVFIIFYYLHNCISNGYTLNSLRERRQQHRDMLRRRDAAIRQIRSPTMSHVPPVNTISDEDNNIPNGYRHAVVVFPTPPPGTSVTVVRPVVIYSTNRHSLLTRYDKDKLPKTKSGTAEGEDDEQEDSSCAICLEPLQNDQVAAPPCAHAMHEKCLQAWFAKREKPVCPVCLTDFSDEEPVIEMHVARQIQIQQETHARQAPALSMQSETSECAVTVPQGSDADNAEPQ